MSAFTTTPVITKMTVVPVAGYDSMLMTLSGAHAPVFTRNLVILEDSAGHTGVGEIHGGDYTCDCLNAMKPLVEGQQISQYRKLDIAIIVYQIRHNGSASSAYGSTLSIGILQEQIERYGNIGICSVNSNSKLILRHYFGIV